MKLKKSDLIEKLVEEISFFTDGETSTKVKTDTARKTVNLFFDSIKETLKALVCHKFGLPIDRPSS